MKNSIEWLAVWAVIIVLITPKGRYLMLQAVYLFIAVSQEVRRAFLVRAQFPWLKFVTLSLQLQHYRIRARQLRIKRFLWLWIRVAVHLTLARVFRFRAKCARLRLMLLSKSFIFFRSSHTGRGASFEKQLAPKISFVNKPDRHGCFNGQMLGHQGFLLTAAQRTGIVRRDPGSAEVIHPYLNGVEVLTLDGAGDRFVLDFEQMDQLTAAGHSSAFAWVRDHVLPDREQKAEAGKDATGKVRPHHKAFLAHWWRLGFGRPEMLSVIKPLPRYLACAYVTKRPIFLFIDREFRPSNLIQVFGFADDYSFGVLQSQAHWLWFTTKCGKLTERFRYSAESVFDTFPWPQFGMPGASQPSVGMLSAAAFAKIAAVATAGRAVRRLRDETLPKLKGGLRALYRTLELPGANPLKDAHAALDAAVLAAYGFDPKADLLAQLLALNLDVAARRDRGEPVTAPGVPADHPAPGSLVTADCIRPRRPDGTIEDGSTAQSYADAAHFYSAKEEQPPYVHR